MKKNITMQDIAERLNISKVTVSKALSDRDGVSDELRNTIKEMAQAMGYRYNSVARDMKVGKKSNVGIIVAERYMKDNAFYIKMYQQVVKSLLKHGYYGIMEHIPYTCEKKLELPNILKDNKVDGIIMLGQMASNYLEIIAKTDVPCVFLDFYDRHMNVDSVLNDNVFGAYVVTDYLIGMNHKKIGYVGNIFSTSSILDRYLGYYKALLTNNIELNPGWVIKDRDDTGELIDLELPEILPSAFVCNSDEIAFSLIKQLNKLGYKVPQDVSVVGFDNSIHATLATPAITTYEVDVEAMAETAVEGIIRKIDSVNYSHGRKVISGRIVIRDSVIAYKG